MLRGGALELVGGSSESQRLVSADWTSSVRLARWSGDMTAPEAVLVVLVVLAASGVSGWVLSLCPCQHGWWVPCSVSVSLSVMTI